MITAELANGYNKDVFAIPGKCTDPKSIGCNELIRKNKAVLLNDSTQLIEMMGWDIAPANGKKVRQQKELFISLSPGEEMVLNILKEKQRVHIDELRMLVNLSSSTIAAAILNLELAGIINPLPGKIYALSH